MEINSYHILLYYINFNFDHHETIEKNKILFMFLSYEIGQNSTKICDSIEIITKFTNWIFKFDKFLVQKYLE